MTSNLMGKERIESAKKLAKAHGVDVLGWKDKPGNEFISVNGDGDKLQTVRKELEEAGWQAWPVNEGAEGHFMDFGMCPPPSDLTKNQSGITADDSPEQQMALGGDFCYQGPDGLFLHNVLAFAVPIVVICLLRSNLLMLKTAERIGISTAAIAFILLPLHWVEISANESTLTIRKHFFGRRKAVPFTNIKKARIYRQRSTIGFITQFLGINLKSGKSFDLFLPKKMQVELAAFIKSRTGA